jgi:hypothetical protein
MLQRSAITGAARTAIAAMALLAAMVLGLGLAPLGANAAPADVASTHAYIRANDAFVRETYARVGSTQASIAGLNRKLGRECRGAGGGSPQNEESQKLSYEVSGALWSVSYGADAGPIRAFAQAVRPLRWSNPKLTRIAQGYARSLRELAALALPNLCGDVRAWSASGFRVVPATTIRFDRHVEAIAGHTIPPRLLSPYEQSADRGVLERTSRLEAKLEHIEVVTGFSDWASLLETLGLNQ